MIRLLAGPLLLAAPACAGAGPERLSVAVAANALPAMAELAQDFTARTGLRLDLVSGASGKFSAQIRAGAPFDFFLSADADIPAELHADGFAEAPRLYARGRLVVWTLDEGFDPAEGLAGLARPSVRKVAVADPRAAPYGRAAREALAQAGVLAADEPKLVVGESVGQTNHFIASGAADAGLTAKSTVFAPQAAGKGRWAEVPAGPRPVGGRSSSRGGRARHPRAVDRLAEFLLSEEARAVWVRFGYEPATPAPPPARR